MDQLWIKTGCFLPISISDTDICVVLLLKSALNNQQNKCAMLACILRQTVFQIFFLIFLSEDFKRPC